MLVARAAITDAYTRESGASSCRRGGRGSPVAVNKKGGPDRRFKDNREPPVCLYDGLSLQSVTGLHEVIQVSRSGVSAGFAEAIRSLGVKVPPERSRPGAMS